MIAFLQTHSSFIQHKRVIEFGAGLGAVSLSVSMLGASFVYATDGSAHVAELIARNIRLNEMSVSEISWGVLRWEEHETLASDFDVAIATDVVYPDMATDQFRNLFAAFQASTESSKGELLLSYKHRCKDAAERFFQCCLDAGFSCQVLEKVSLDSVILRIHRTESLPQLDPELEDFLSVINSTMYEDKLDDFESVLASIEW